jgi:peptidoglycan/xylan/chitin deacetylase (PgdA/CDA1 family)
MYLSFVVNFEEGSEISFLNGDIINNAIYDGHDNIDGRDYCLSSHFEYSLYEGIDRILDLFNRYRTKATFSCCGLSAYKHPEIIKKIYAHSHEISAHGWRWQNHVFISLDEETVDINNTKQIIYELTGKFPVGWHTRSSRSPQTRQLLYDAGFVYDSDDYSRDSAYLCNDFSTPYAIIPYSFDTNDMQFLGRGNFLQGNDFFLYIKSAIEWILYEESLADLNSNKIVTVGLHPRIIGRAGRICGLKELLNWIDGNEKINISTREGIARDLIKRITPS